MKTKREELNKLIVAYGEMMMKAGCAMFPMNMMYLVQAAAIVIQYNAMLSLIIDSSPMREETLEEAAMTAKFVVGTAQDAAEAILQRIEDIPK